MICQLTPGLQDCYIKIKKCVEHLIKTLTMSRFQLHVNSLLVLLLMDAVKQMHANHFGFYAVSSIESCLIMRIYLRLMYRHTNLTMC